MKALREFPSRPIGQLVCSLKNRVEHGLGELAGECVLLTRVIGTEQTATTEIGLGDVSETRTGPRH